MQRKFWVKKSRQWDCMKAKFTAQDYSFIYLKKKNPDNPRLAICPLQVYQDMKVPNKNT